jgi:hypothetical protein
LFKDGDELVAASSFKRKIAGRPLLRAAGQEERHPLRRMPYKKSKKL